MEGKASPAAGRRKEGHSVNEISTELLRIAAAIGLDISGFGNAEDATDAIIEKIEEISDHSNCAD